MSVVVGARNMKFTNHGDVSSYYWRNAITSDSQPLNENIHYYLIMSEVYIIIS